MANRTFDNVQALNKEVKVISGQILASDPLTDPDNLSWANTEGIGFSADSNGNTGEIVITLQDNYVGLLSCTTNSLTATGIEYQTLLAEDVESTTSPGVTLQNIDGAGAKGNLAAGDIVFFTLVLRNSTVQ